MQELHNNCTAKTIYHNLSTHHLQSHVLEENCHSRNLVPGVVQMIPEMNIIPGLSESFEVGGWVVKVSGQSRDVLFQKRHL